MPSDAAPTIRYALEDDAWSRFLRRIERLVAENGVRRICEVGAGANPALPLEFLSRNGLECTLVDVSGSELGKASAAYARVVADVQSPRFVTLGPFDLVCTRMVAEHVRDPELFHRNIRAVLAPGRWAFHFFPTLYAPPFVLNRLLPEAMTSWLLAFVQENRESEGKHGKFRPYYRWCRGPTRRQLREFERLGYRVEEYFGFFGFGGYVEKTRPLHRVERRLAAALVQRPVPALTSYAQVLLRKDAATVSE